MQYRIARFAATLGGGGGVTPTGLLRAVSPLNHLAGLATAITNRTRWAGRARKIIGAGDVRKLVVVTSNFALSTTGVSLPGNTCTVTAYLCEIATGVSVALTVGGSSSIALANGATNIRFDDVLPVAFSKTKFTLNDHYEVRYEAEVPTNGSFCTLATVPAPGEEARNYDPAATTLTNLSGSGAFVFTGTAPTSQKGLSFILLGEFVSGDPIVVGGFGDSIMDFRDDTSNNTQSGTPNGFFTAFLDRSLWSAPGVSDPRAGINFAKNGGLVGLTAAAAAYINPYMQYCNTFVEEFGTNSLTAGSNTGDVSALVTATRNLWTQIRTNAAVSGGRAVKIIRTKLLCRTTGAWALADGSDQTIFGQWGAGGDVELFNAAMLADVGVAGRTDAYVDFDNVVRLGAAGTPEF